MITDVQTSAKTTRNDKWCPKGWEHVPSEPDTDGREICCVFDPENDTKLTKDERSKKMQDSMTNCRKEKAWFYALSGSDRKEWTTRWCQSENKKKTRSED